MRKHIDNQTEVEIVRYRHKNETQKETERVILKERHGKSKKETERKKGRQR